MKQYARRKDKNRLLMQYADQFHVERLPGAVPGGATAMIRSSRQLKDFIHNLSRERRADAQVLMRNYMMERFLERVSLSAHTNAIILKGGMLPLSCGECIA
jgi:hypothetical protein